MLFSNYLKSSLFILICLSLSFTGQSQTFRTITRLPTVVEETSGIEVSGPNKVWTFNDSGGAPELYLCDTLGNLLKTLKISGATNRDWEDITQDDQGNFYIGNMGNNNNANRDLSIFKIPNPDRIEGNRVAAQIIKFNYEDQFSFPPPADSMNFDCEALIWSNGQLLLFTKHRTLPMSTNLYIIPDAPGTHIAQKVSSFKTGDANPTNFFNYWITAGDISPDGRTLCLLSQDKMWIFYNFQGTDFFNGQHLEIDFPSSTQKEGVGFVSNTEVYISDEQGNGDTNRKLYGVNLKAVISEAMETPGTPMDIQIARNRSGNKLKFKGNLKAYYFQIQKETGMEHQSFTPSGNKFRANIRELSDGPFAIRMTNKINGKIWRERMMKN